MIYNSHSDIEAIGADFVMEIKESEQITTTYVMSIDTQKLDKSKPADSQPIWKIKRIKEVKVGENQTCTYIEYPNGLNGYIFQKDRYNEYTYSYRKY